MHYVDPINPIARMPFEMRCENCNEARDALKLGEGYDRLRITYVAVLWLDAAVSWGNVRRLGMILDAHTGADSKRPDSRGWQRPLGLLSPAFLVLVTTGPDGAAAVHPFIPFEYPR